MYVQTSSIRVVGIGCGFSLAFCIHSIVMRQHLDITTATIDSVSAEIVRSFATRGDALFVHLIHNALQDSLVVKMTSVRLWTKETDLKCSDTG